MSSFSLPAYHACLVALRREWSAVRRLPERRFFLFGMGPRRKLQYAGGCLADASDGTPLFRWPVAVETIIPPEYRLRLGLEDGTLVEIYEDEDAVWLVEAGRRQVLSQGRVSLPDFPGHPWAPILRVLHQEILLNIVAGQPLPNQWVYSRPWLRDAALVGMVLKETGNLDLIRAWILGLRQPFDRNNAGECEADNLGQALYLVSLVSDRRHPLVDAVLQELPRFTSQSALVGRTDFAGHPVYQTKWIKFGLACLGLPDPFRIPPVVDSYSALFWWEFTHQHLPYQAQASPDYPYLAWAEDNFYRTWNAPVGSLAYPLTWEANASQADYAKMAVLFSQWADQKICATHSWHAAEMFLRLYNDRSHP